MDLRMVTEWDTLMWLVITDHDSYGIFKVPYKGGKPKVAKSKITKIKGLKRKEKLN